MIAAAYLALSIVLGIVAAWAWLGVDLGFDSKRYLLIFAGLLSVSSAYCFLEVLVRLFGGKAAAWIIGVIVAAVVIVALVTFVATLKFPDNPFS